MQSDAHGSGICLAIVQRIVELHEGQVWIEGDEHEGLHGKVHHDLIEQSTIDLLTNVKPDIWTRVFKKRLFLGIPHMKVASE